MGKRKVTKGLVATPAQLDKLIEEAPVDCYNEEEQASGFFTMIDEPVNYIVRKVDLNEYKRKQAAPGLKITPLAFGVGRRIPIVQKYVS